MKKEVRMPTFFDTGILFSSKRRTIMDVPASTNLQPHGQCMLSGHMAEYMKKNLSVPVPMASSVAERFAVLVTGGSGYCT